MPRAQRTHVAALFASCVGLAGLGVTAPTRADESPRARTEAALAALDADPAAHKLTEPVIARARQALERAANARRGGDHAHGSALEALAAELADAAADLVRTEHAEAQANAAQQKALDLETRVVRARALVEQAAARRGRASEKLQSVEAERAKTPAAPSKAGAKKPTASAAAPKAPGKASP
jgi:hypothetical protein